MRQLPPLAIALPVLLAGCATAPAGDYPSLAIRDMERVEGTLEAPDSQRFVPDPPAPATLDRLGDLQAEAAAAHAHFLEAAPAARSTVGAASGAAAGSENWARAQAALADLETRRSQAMVALADLDRIYVDAATSGNALQRIASARDEVMALVEEEDRLIAALYASLR